MSFYEFTLMFIQPKKKKKEWGIQQQKKNRENVYILYISLV